MLNVNELRNGAVFTQDNNIWQVLNYEHIKMGRGSGTIKLKVRNLRSGSITEKSFITGARVDEANVEKKKTQYLYRDKGTIEARSQSEQDSYQDGDNYHFMDPVTFEQFPINHSILGDDTKYLKEGLEVVLIVSGDEALAIELPNTVTYTVTDTGPEEKGNTVSNVFKEATLEGGLNVRVPMFMKVGEKVKIDTRTGQYMERVK